jgi:AraC family ethanolamine operon transcriptional activator
MKWTAECGEQPNPAGNGLQVSIGHIAVEDVCLWEETSRPWELIARQIDGGKFRNRKDYLVTPSVVLYRETLTPAVRVHGLTPAGHLTFAVPLRVGPRTAYFGVQPESSRLTVVAPGGLDVTLDAEYSHLILLVRMEMLQRRLPAEGLATLTRAADRHGLALGQNKLAGFRDWLTSVLEQAFDNPQAFDHPAVIASLEEGLLCWLAWISVSSDGSSHAARRRRGLNRVLEYLRTADVSRVSVADLCRVARVSERTLRYAFRDEIDLSPLAFLRRLRLHAARRELMNAEGAVPRVSDVARREGFWELGRFAADYRRLFGEPPSETLAHRRKVARSPLLLV